MTCKEVIRDLSEYLDGELEPALVETLNRHMEHCEDCRLVVDTTRKTIEIYCDTSPLPLPEGVRDRLGQILAEKFRKNS